MPRHVGASHFHDGSLRERTRKSRRNRGHRLQSRKDKAAFIAARREQSWH